MYSPAIPWLGILLLVLFCVLLFLRLTFSCASKRSQMIVTAAQALLFFALCSSLRS
jgi:hypothetical protein